MTTFVLKRDKRKMLTGQGVNGGRRKKIESKLKKQPAGPGGGETEHRFGGVSSEMPKLIIRVRSSGA